MQLEAIFLKIGNLFQIYRQDKIIYSKKIIYEFLCEIDMAFFIMDAFTPWTISICASLELMFL